MWHQPDLQRSLIETEAPARRRPFADRELLVRSVDDAKPTAVSMDQVSSISRITPARAITAGGAVIFLVLGLTALARGGLGGALDEPVVSVANFKQTPLLGLIGTGFGLVFLLAAVFGGEARSRSVGAFFGALLAIGGIIAILTPEHLRQLAIESSYGWLAVTVGGVIALANSLAPTVTRERVTYR